MHPALDKLCGPGKPLKPEAPDASEVAGPTGWKFLLHRRMNCAVLPPLPAGKQHSRPKSRQPRSARFRNVLHHAVHIDHPV